jgi:hypothetical protein
MRKNTGSCKTMQDFTKECTVWMMDCGYQCTVVLYIRFYDTGDVYFDTNSHNQANDCVDEHVRMRAREHIHSSHRNTENHICPSLSMSTYALATRARTSLIAFDDSPASVIWIQ